MEGGISGGGGAPIRNRVDKGRRGWSVREEQVLAETMKKIVRGGWKSENGFRTGYLAVLAHCIRLVFPNTDIKHEPHIMSRITVWKKNYHTLYEMLSITGVGLDSTSKMVEATDEQWVEMVKKDPNARLMRHKSWPLYDDWCEIFGVSRATGEGAFDFFSAAIPPNDDDLDVSVDDGSTRVNEEHQGESQTPTGNTQNGERRTTTDPFISVMQSFCDTATARLGEIAQRIGYEQDSATARREIFKSVSAMNMLMKQEMLCDTSLIARSVEDTDVFFSLPEADRLEYVLMLLQPHV